MQQDAPVHNGQARHPKLASASHRVKVRRLRRLKYIVLISHDQQLDLIQEARAARNGCAIAEADYGQRR
jgi:hypothetical protein